MDQCTLLFPVSVRPLSRSSSLGRLARGVDHLLCVTLCYRHSTHLRIYSTHLQLQASILSLKLEALN